MLLAFRSSISLLLAATAFAQLPDGAGRAETEKLCKGCHELARSVSLRQDRAGWETTVAKMVALGVKGTDAELKSVVDYLAQNFPPGDVPPIQVNKARAIELESGLSLKRSEATAIIRYRDEHGPFKSIENLKKVPGIDAAKVESKKSRLVF